MIDSNRITTALLLAAGTGSRLRPLTQNAPKCLTEVGDRPILDRLVAQLAGVSSLREVIAFPKTTSAACPLTGAPGEVGDTQLGELGIRLTR